MTLLVATGHSKSRLFVKSTSLKREKEKIPELKERAAVLPHELKTLRCPIRRDNDTIADAMRALYEGQQ